MKVQKLLIISALVDSLYEVSDYSGFAEQNGNNISWNFNLDFYPFIYSGYELRLFVDVAIPGDQLIMFLLIQQE